MVILHVCVRMYWLGHADQFAVSKIYYPLVLAAYLRQGGAWWAAVDFGRTGPRFVSLPLQSALYWWPAFPQVFDLLTILWWNSCTLLACCPSSHAMLHNSKQSHMVPWVAGKVQFYMRVYANGKTLHCQQHTFRSYTGSKENWHVFRKEAIASLLTGCFEAPLPPPSHGWWSSGCHGLVGEITFYLLIDANSFQ